MSRHKKIARRARRRKHARRHAGTISANTKVYAATAWWRHNDPYTQVIGLDAARVEKAIRAAMDDMAHDAYSNDEYETMDAAMDAIAWSGVHAFSLGTLVSGRELDDAIAELKDDQLYYPDMA